MTDLNNLLGVVGAIVPSFYTAQSLPKLPDTYLNRFAYSTIWGLAVVLATCLVIHDRHLRRPVPWVNDMFQADVQLVVYILIIGFGGLCAIDLVFHVVADVLKQHKAVQGAITTLLLVAAVGIAAHLSLINNQYDRMILSEADVIDFPSLAVKLKKSLPNDRVSPFVQQHLSATTQDALYHYHGGPDPVLKAALVSDLNRLLTREPLFDRIRFEHVRFSKETERLLQSSGDARDIGRLNRSLLADAYPNEIALPRSLEP